MISIKPGRLFSGDYSYFGEGLRGSDYGDGSRNGRKCWDSREVLKVKPTEFSKD